MTDGVVATSLLSRLERFEMFFGKIFVMLLMELSPVLSAVAGSCPAPEATLEVEGKPREARACALKAVVAPEAESEVTLWRMLGEEIVRVPPDITGGPEMLLRY